MKIFAQLFAVLLFGSGCATSALWEEGQFARFHEPTTPSKLELFDSGKQNKFLIVYEEGNDENNARRIRAYWAGSLASAPQGSFRPVFVSPKKAKGLPRIPIVEAPAPTGYSAVLTNDTHAFVLFKDGGRLGFFDLPVYADGSGRAKQVALTPFAVAADATIVGGIAAVVIAYWYAGGSGFPNLWPSSETK